MKRNYLKIMLVITVVSAMVWGMAFLSSVQAATEGIPDISIGTGSGTTSGGSTGTTGNGSGTTTNGTGTTGTTGTNQTPTTGTSTPRTNTTTNSSSIYANSNLPQTGITEDYAIVGLLIVCGISAIYAYTRIRNYKG